MKSTKPLVTPRPENKLLNFKVQLIEADTKDEKPLSGFKVKVSLVDGKETREIVKTITDKNGNFSFHHLAEKGKETEEYEFNLVISDSQGNEVHTKTISVKPPVEKNLVVKIPMSEYRRKIAVPIEDITEELGYKLPSGLFSVLKKNNIETLEDIRKNKGLKHLKDLPVVNDHPDINRLEGHAYLHTLSKDIHLNGFLIEKGYTSPSVIGDGSLSKFIKDTQSKLKKEEAERLWKQARKQNRTLDLIASNYRIAKAKGNGKSKGGAEPGLSDENKEPCVCKECDAAVSPRAYLIQLLDYVVQNLDITGTGNDTEKDILEWLSDTFCLHFDDFSFSCEAMEEEVLQIRLCIEVLWDFLNDEGDLEDKQKEYCLKAYETLLTQIGTSRDELRLMRGVASSVEDQRKDELESLERRLGFRLSTENENRLEQLYRHRDEITEAALEMLFGLLKTDPDQPRWPAPPLVAKWRKEYLRELWGKEDRRESETTWDLPIVDPDLIGIDDIRIPKTEFNPDGSLSLDETPASFELWKKRCEWIDERIGELTAKASNIQNIFMDIMTIPIAYNGGSTWPIVPGALPERIEIIDDRHWLKEWVKLEKKLKENLSEESFERLMEIWKKDAVQRTSEEIEELIYILINFQKKQLEQVWNEEEGDLLLGSADFWEPLTEPLIGEWPPPNHESQPLIDPDTIEKTDLRYVFGLTLKNGKTFSEVWKERQAVLRNLQLDLLLEQENIAGMVYLAFIRPLTKATDPLPEINNLSGDIATTALTMDERYNTLKNAREADPLINDDITDAEDAIKLEYNNLLSIEEFETLINIKRKVSTTNRPTTDEWTEAVAIIKSAFKKRADWKSEEIKDDASSFKYWEILKAKLPKWRADAGTRHKWQTALKANSSVPIIEPDLIFIDDIKIDDLKQLRKERNIFLNEIITDPGTPPASSSAEDQLIWLQNALKDKVGFLQQDVDDPDEVNTSYEFNDLV
ncbi:MAG: carboxypeptidase-like regulatory domain-containing protein [Desulfobacula sp.]|nr:carboxypeptidase-like regulatory domain-containing protein [Desulfobacula sp.]